MAQMPLNNLHILSPFADGRLGVECCVMRHFIVSNMLAYNNQNVLMR